MDARVLIAGHKAGQRLSDKLVEDLGSALLARHKTYALTCHKRACIDVAVDDRASERTRPKVLDFELGLLLRQLSSCEPIKECALHGDESLGCRVV